jgi:hypothetical protein
MRLFLVAWVCACLWATQGLPTISFSVTPSSFGIQDVATYTFKISIFGDGVTNLTIPVGSNIIINLPSPYPSAAAISNNCLILSWPIASGSITCTLAYNVITISNGFTNAYQIYPDTNDQLNFVVNTITNPTYAQQINNPPISASFSFAN